MYLMVSAWTHTNRGKNIFTFWKKKKYKERKRKNNPKAKPQATTTTPLKLPFLSLQAAFHFHIILVCMNWYLRTVVCPVLLGEISLYSFGV